MSQTIGFLGGSFDPIHFGHIGLAIQLMESHQLSKVIFCPAFCSPFKLETPPSASPKHRLHMLKLALDHPAFEICTLELDRKGPSYTIDTIRALEQQGFKLRLLLSDESAQNLHRWKETEHIVKSAPPLSGPREFKISSTEIRNRLKKKLYCG
ncbi:MAG: nicotinate-nicotinamide nucleotide adenylyltransferase, partial [Verrucomicrobiota bacterium]|nr:nicotinate-nicotinamide nucleotide adenylyltransferase [Verrucomicrobiota bacterium]